MDQITTPDGLSPVSAPFFLAGRPTTYKGVPMRSRLEATWAAYLDRLGLPWEYEPRCFANERGQYLPDFYVLTGRSEVYLEVKGLLGDPVAALRRMEIVLDSEPKATLALVRGEPWSSAPIGAEDDPTRSFWIFSREWYRVCQYLSWYPPARVREWECCPDGEDWFSTVHYEFRMEGEDW